MVGQAGVRGFFRFPERGLAFTRFFREEPVPLGNPAIDRFRFAEQFLQFGIGRIEGFLIDTGNGSNRFAQALLHGFDLTCPSRKSSSFAIAHFIGKFAAFAPNFLETVVEFIHCRVAFGSRCGFRIGHFMPQAFEATADRRQCVDFPAVQFAAEDLTVFTQFAKPLFRNVGKLIGLRRECFERRIDTFAQ